MGKKEKFVDERVARSVGNGAITTRVARIDREGGRRAQRSQFSAISDDLRGITSP